MSRSLSVLAAVLCALLTLVLGLMVAVVLPSLGASMIFEQYLPAVVIVPTIGTIMLVLLVAAWWSSKATRKLSSPILEFFDVLPQKLSFWRAIGAAFVTQVLGFLLFMPVYWLLRPFVWAAVYGEPYRPPPGPHPAGSGEWLIMQALGLSLSMAAGAMAFNWSPPRARTPLLFLVGLSLLLLLGELLYGTFPLKTAFVLNLFYAMRGPFGLILGAVLFKRWKVRASRLGIGADDA